MDDMGEMDGEPQTQAQRASNLARIRDNQRRSRARRKEYLQELESKYRSCEQVGIEASAEIQAAARRVVEENKRLRLILKQRGLSDLEIDSITSDVEDNSPYPTAANMLEGMIGQRKMCRPGIDCAPNSEGKCETPVTPTPPSATTPNSATLRSPSVQQPPARNLMPQNGTSTTQYLSPDLLAQSGVNMQHIAPQTTAYPDPLLMAQQQQQQHHQQQQQRHASIDYGMSYDDTFVWQDQYNIPQSSAAPANLPPSSSCYVAADAIRSIKPELGQELENELGCGDGRECAVPNTHIFDIMDRYTTNSHI